MAFDPTKPVEGYLALSADGRWLYQGEPITHPGLVRILEENYARDGEGRYVVSLRLPQGVQKVLVAHEDTPYFVKDVDLVEGAVLARLNDTRTLPLEAPRVRMRANGRGYLRVGEGEWAAFTRQAELRMADFIEERDGRLGLRIGGAWQPVETEG